MKLKAIGILGGMGPEATILLQRRILAAVKASDDADHIPLKIDMNPQVPSRISWLLENKGSDPAPVLAAMAKSLEAAGAVALAMPCNTAHTFASAIQKAVTIPLLHMPELAVVQIAQRVGPQARVGILASPATEKTGLFRDLLAEHGIDAIYPNDQESMLQTIRTIKSNGVSAPAVKMLQRNADELVRRGVQALLIGCSEFSLVSREVQAAVPLVDTLDVLVEEIVRTSGMRQSSMAPPYFDPAFADPRD